MLTVATHNCPARVGADAQQRIPTRLAEHADIIVMQEADWLVNDRGDVPDGFTLKYGNHKALPILFRSARLTLTGEIDRRAYPDWNVGSWGAGPPTMRAGWDYGVRLHDKRDGDDLWVLNAHLVPSTGEARPDNPDDADGWEERRRLYRREIGQIVDMTSWVDVEPVLVGGDFNGDPDSHDLLAPMREAFDGYVSAPTFGDGRRLDHWWYRAARPGRSWKMPTASDHDALFVEFTHNLT